MSDKYDKAMAWFRAQPDVTAAIRECWWSPSEEGPGCLFQFAELEWATETPQGPCGCLTQIRGGQCVAETANLTEAIRADERIPMHYQSITPENLEVFAEWQRRIDKELGRCKMSL